METNILCFLRFVRCSFKSYYVVWKLFSSAVRPSSLQLFKSYYVVWKLYSKSDMKNLISKFKSYYVVWKLIEVSPTVKVCLSLNRTM